MEFTYESKYKSLCFSGMILKCTWKSRKQICLGRQLLKESGCHRPSWFLALYHFHETTFTLSNIWDHKCIYNNLEDSDSAENLRKMIKNLCHILINEFFSYHCVYKVHGAGVEVRGQFCTVGSLFPFLCGFQELNSGSKALFTCRTTLSASLLYILCLYYRLLTTHKKNHKQNKEWRKRNCKRILLQKFSQML